MPKLRLLTYNCKMLSNPAGIGTDRKYRARRICERILAAKPPYDFVCLQEVFSRRKRFVEPLAERYGWIIKKRGDDVFGRLDDSGLLIASRWPLLDVDPKRDFWLFKKGKNVDRLAAKGVVRALVDLSALADGVKVVLFSTHLQAAYKEPTQYHKTRTKQLMTVRSAVDEVLAGAGEPAKLLPLLCGDFNIVGDTDEAASMIETLGHPIDLYRSVYSDPGRYPGYTFDGLNNTEISGADKKGRRRYRLDYVMQFGSIGEKRTLVTKTDSIAVVRWRDDKKRDLSDHYGIDTMLSWRSNAAGREGGEIGPRSLDKG
jgi:endonuclease/exonuclease/phosphatase family metal-dependent hydrolase